MNRWIPKLALTGTLVALLPGHTAALTREIAELQPARLTFDRSVLNQLTYGTYREPFDELQTRSYNLLFSNIGRHANLSPWQGQEGTYTRYVNALIGNNGTTEVESGVDSIQGSMIRRETERFTWGLSLAFLSGNDETGNDTPTTVFTNIDNLSGFDTRFGGSLQLSEKRVIGFGTRWISASSEVTDRDFEQGVSGTNNLDEFDQTDISFDVGLRSFLNPTSSWEILLVAGNASFEKLDQSQNLDGTGAVVDRFVTTNYEVTDTRLGVHAGYNRLRTERLGETEFRAGLERFSRELDNDDLSFFEDTAGVTPSLTLLDSDPLDGSRVFLSAKTVLEAGQTQLFTGAELAFSTLEGSTTRDAAGLNVTELIDDSTTALGLTLGLRQPLFDDKIRFIVSGRADLFNTETATLFDDSGTSTDGSQTITRYGIGVEGALANVTFDVAWLFSEDAPIPAVDLGLPTGSRRVVEFDRLVVSAAVSW